MNSSAMLYSDKAAAYFGQPRIDIQDLLPTNPSRVLEIGCGAGETMRWLRGIRQIEHASGVELIPSVARVAASAFDVVIVGNIESLDLEIPPNSLDMIIALDVLEHLVDPWRVIQLCNEMLKPGGVMIASIPNIAHYSVAFPLMLRGLWSYKSDGLLDRTHLRFFVAQTAIDLMTSSGLAVEQVERTRIPPNFLNSIPDRFGGRSVRWYAVKFLSYLPASHLFDFRYLIRVKKPT
jgi:SAM-dependent methyltransferase